MPKSVKQPEISELEEPFFEGLEEPESEEPEDPFLVTLREAQAFADRLRLPVEALQRLQVAAILTLVQETRRLQETLAQARAVAAGVGGFDPQYFRDLIKRELGAEIDDQTLQRAFRLASDPARLERAIVSTKKAMETVDVSNPIGLLIRKLQDWRSRDSKRR